MPRGFLLWLLITPALAGDTGALAKAYLIE
jgi:hypothetical protein